ncbi:M20 family metallopeptidase [Candidatus Bathyarchaeota archaeon]|nr:M20 family metallopeptidase [Candidatus Bathyarchaeota archaeon]
MERLLEEIDRIVERRRGEAIRLLRELIRTPSLSGEEGEAALIVGEHLRAAGLKVEVDEIHNVKAEMRGIGGGRSILFNGHLDHVPPGTMADPYSAKIMDGSAFGVEGEVIYGRGACDMKGGVAAMAMALSILRELETPLLGDVKLAAVAQEETSGYGTLKTIRDGFLGDLAVIGEATNLNIHLGHRGAITVRMEIRGRSCHASAPDRGVNPLYKAAEIIQEIRSRIIPMLPTHPEYGETTLAVTMLKTRPEAVNVIPGVAEITMDCRNTPNLTPEELRRMLELLIEELRKRDPELDASVEIMRRIEDHPFTGYRVDPDQPMVREAKRAVEEAIKRDVKLGMWRFMTDGRFYAWRGIPAVGFGPGEERFAHTDQDHIRIEDYINAIKAYAWMACRICGVK